jgi:acyl-CoA synthetase (AMP-forming)/AMP-acid ligase II
LINVNFGNDRRWQIQVNQANRVYGATSPGAIGAGDGRKGEWSLATDLLAFGLSNQPDRAAVVCDDVELSFRQVHWRANRLAGYFDELGLKPGDRVALLAKNEYQYLEIQVACMRRGLILVPLNFRLAVPELAYIISDCDPSLLIVSRELVSSSDDLKISCLILDDAYEQMVVGEDDKPLVQIDLSADCTILYTSGTTGRPKGAVLTNQSLYARLNANFFEYQISPGDIFLQCLPLFHIASNVSYSYTYAGATNVFLKDFHPLAVLDLVERHEVSTALLVPTMINAVIHQPEVARADLLSLKKIAYGASPMPPSVLASAIETFRCEFLQLYGMTETSAATVLRPEHHNPEARPDLLASAGQAGVGMEVRVVDDDDHEVPLGDVGEIVCCGEAVMRAYWGNADASTAALKGGWMHTGDMGYCDSEGFYFITDRKKDMIVSGGENIYPREVEDALFEHADILEAAVIGIPSEKWGEQVHAILVAENGKELDPGEVLTFARERLAGYKVPKSVEISPGLPKNATGKVLKTELRQLYWQDHDRSVS